MKNLVHYLLKNRTDIPLRDWTAQGFGFLRLRIDESTRLHIWDSRLRSPIVSDIHDHTQWAFTSNVISGQIINVRYEVCSAEADKEETIRTSGRAMLPYNQAILNCGIGGGMQEGTIEPVLLLPGAPELYVAGDSYRQEPDEVHRTIPTDGTVTLITQQRKDVDTARVFFPRGAAWGDAVPRPATLSEVDEIGAYALSIFN